MSYDESHKTTTKEVNGSTVTRKVVGGKTVETMWCCNGVGRKKVCLLNI